MKQNVGLFNVELPKFPPNVHAIEAVFGVLFTKSTHKGAQPDVAVEAEMFTTGSGLTVTVTELVSDGVPHPSVIVTV